MGLGWRTRPPEPVQGSRSGGRPGASSGHPTEPDPNSNPIPAQVSGQPSPEPEPALAGGAITPRRWHLRHAHAQRVSLDRELEPELEAACRLDRHPLQEPLRIEPVVAGGVVAGKA